MISYQFSKGDKVQLITNRYGNSRRNPFLEINNKKVTGTVTNVAKIAIYVEWNYIEDQLNEEDRLTIEALEEI